jgi:hypothetical protein
MNLEVGLVDQVGRPACIVKRTADAVKTVKNADRVRRKRHRYYDYGSYGDAYASNPSFWSDAFPEEGYQTRNLARQSRISNSIEGLR